MLNFILFIRSIRWTAVFAAVLSILALAVLFVDAPKAIALALVANVLATLRAKEN